MAVCQRRATLIITAYKEVAATKLVCLTACDKEVTARQACLDILAMDDVKKEKVNRDERREMKPATQAAILKIMADEKVSPSREGG